MPAGESYVEAARLGEYSPDVNALNVATPRIAAPEGNQFFSREDGFHFTNHRIPLFDILLLKLNAAHDGSLLAIGNPLTVVVGFGTGLPPVPALAGTG